MSPDRSPWRSLLGILQAFRLEDISPHDAFEVRCNATENMQNKTKGSRALLPVTEEEYRADHAFPSLSSGDCLTLTATPHAHLETTSPTVRIVMLVQRFKGLLRSTHV